MFDETVCDLIVDFFSAYENLSHVGKCDSPCGMECRRVFQEWCERVLPRLAVIGRNKTRVGFPQLQAAHPGQADDHRQATEAFIVERANIGPYAE